MDYFISIYIFISLLFTPVIIYRTFKLNKYIDKLESNFLTLIQTLEESNEKKRDLILNHVKNTEVYQQAIKNQMN